MRPAPRRLTFQLVSLFDLLIIIIFAQYFDLQDKTGRKLAEASQEQAGSPDAAALQRELDRLLLDRAAEQEGAVRRQVQQTEDLRQAREDLARLSALVAEMFNLPEDALDDMLKSRSPQEAERIRQALRALAANRSSQAVRHILTLAELEKRCDLWQVHVRDDGGYSFTFDDRQARFRAGSADRFAAELFKQYKSLPQPKSLVLILLSWGDADLRSRTAAVEGLEQAAERMRADSDRRSRFEYALLGYIPSAD